MSYWKATKKELRNTGLVVGIAFAVLGVAQVVFHGKIPPPVCFGISAVLILLGLLAPVLLRPFHFVWMKFSEVLGWVMNRVILGLLFFVFVTLTGLVLRLIGRDRMHRDFRKRQESYWVPRSEAPNRPERYERQF